MKMTFAEQILQFNFALPNDLPKPDGIEVLFPYGEKDTREAMKNFYTLYYSDKSPRTYIFGINPGRFGAGVTGVPFTDPIRLSESCLIENSFKKKAELSSQFVYEFIEAYGGVKEFYSDFYITAVSPLGFLKDGKNFNYYDSRDLQQMVEPFIIDCIETQLKFGAVRKQAISLGEGKNYMYFKELNEKYNFFETIHPLPHPRWVMQYRRKYLDSFVEKYLDVLEESKPSN